MVLNYNLVKVQLGSEPPKHFLNEMMLGITLWLLPEFKLNPHCFLYVTLLE